MSYLEQNRERVIKMGLPDSVQELEAVLQMHSWFTTARILISAATKEHDPKLDIALLLAPTPKPLLKDVSPEILTSPKENDWDPEERRGHRNSDIIDAFLSNDPAERRVVPNPEMDEYDAAEQSGVLDITEDMLSQDLADIYRAQGLTELADKIVSQLRDRVGMGE